MSRKPKHVVMFLLNAFTNDARVLRESKALLAAGLRVTIIAVRDPDRPDLPDHDMVEGIQVRRVSRKVPLLPIAESGRGPGRLLRRLVIMARMVLEGIRQRADVLHAHDLNTLPAVIMARMVRWVPLVYDSHEAATGRVGHDRWYMRLLERCCLPFCSRIIATTETRAKFMVELYGCPQPVIVGNVVDLELAETPVRDVHSELNIPAGEPVVVYQGGVQAGRGLEQVLHSLREWERGVLLIVGDGPILAQIQALSRELGVYAKVRFTGKVPLHELLGYTKAANIGLQVLQNTCFNHYSTDSNKLFEYFAAGIPVIASDFPEIRKLVSEHHCGLLIDPHDPSNIARAVNQLLADLELCQELGRNGESVLRQHNWETESGKLLHLYCEMITG